MTVQQALVLKDVAQIIDCEHRTVPRAREGEAYGYSIGTGSIRDGRIDLSKAKPVTRSAYEDWTRRAVPRSGDIILAREAPIGETALVPASTPTCLGQRTVLIRPDQTRLNTRFLYYWLLSPHVQRWFQAKAMGSTVLHVNVADVRNTTIGNLPELVEQERIVEILEDHISRLDAAEGGVNAVLGRLTRLQDRFIQARLLGETAPGPRVPSALQTAGVDDGRLSPLPEGWEWRRLGELAEVVGGVTKDAKRQSDPTFVEVPYLRVANVQRGRLDLDNVTTIRVPPNKALSLQLQPGDVLLNEGGDRDKLARGWVWEGQIEDCIHQNHVFRARIRDDQLEPKLLSWAANTLGAPWAERNGKQSVNLASISLSKIRLMPIPVPPRPAQASLVQSIHDQVAAIYRLTTELRSVHQRSAALRRAMLHAAFSGQLTGRASDMEMVEEMAGV